MNQSTSKNLFLVLGGLALGVLVVLGLLAAVWLRSGSQAPKPDYYPTQGWRTSIAEEQGFDSAKLAEGLLAAQKHDVPIHSVMMVRRGQVILDAYFYPYDGSIYHDLASVTKTVMTTLIGIAATQGKLDLDQPMVSFFPDRTIANLDERKQRITVRHLASNSSGLGCDPNDEEKTMRVMRASPDWVQFSLDLPVVHEPGERFIYCNAGMHLLSAILQQTTGMTALEFGRAYLFGPLGIRDVSWPTDPQGFSRGWGDISLRPHDAAKLGYLWFYNGQWEDKQIVSSQWVQESVKPLLTHTGKPDAYGYGWWVLQEGDVDGYFASGRGGQRILVVPAMDLIVVTTGGGFEWSEIDIYILAAIGDLEKPLPANPAGVASLEAALVAIARGPDPKPVPPLPARASVISGQTFVFEQNKINISSARLDFDSSAEATLTFNMAYEGERVSGVGLDGRYRPSRSGRPAFARGNWTETDTFVIVFSEGPGLNNYTITMTFGDQGLIFNFEGLKLQGRLQAP